MKMKVFGDAFSNNKKNAFLVKGKSQGMYSNLDGYFHRQDEYQPLNPASERFSLI
jgi:hypothetical protein